MKYLLIVILISGYLPVLAQATSDNLPKDSVKVLNRTESIETVKRNILSMDIFEFAIFNEIEIDYIRFISEDAKIGILTRLAFDLPSNRKIEYDFRNRYCLGLGMNYYPVGHHKWCYFAGIEAVLGSAEYSNYITVYRNYDPTYYYVNDNYLFLKTLINNGLLLSHNNWFYASAVASFGIKYSYHSDIDGIKPSFIFSINMGARF
ncbi:MAG: hypothetical protein K9G76_10185 [Bacteroidales bacterium]|nr:hypothetical protein [Bacteroidales bacterium]MCF8404069.1 hypothetical protein [Bacteroidales bacterium]